MVKKEEALDAFVQPEILDDSNKYFCSNCQRQCKAHKVRIELIDTDLRFKMNDKKRVSNLSHFRISYLFS